MKEQAKQVSQAHAGATQLEKKDSGSSLPVGSILPVRSRLIGARLGIDCACSSGIGVAGEEGDHA